MLKKVTHNCKKLWKYSNKLLNPILVLGQCAVPLDILMESSSNSPDFLPSCIQQLLQHAISALTFFRRQQALNAKIIFMCNLCFYSQCRACSLPFVLTKWITGFLQTPKYQYCVRHIGLFYRAFCFPQIGIFYMHKEALVCYYVWRSAIKFKNLKQPLFCQTLDISSYLKFELLPIHIEKTIQQNFKSVFQQPAENNHNNIQ